MPDSSDNVNSGARASGTVDWSRPIEAVHEDGRVMDVTGVHEWANDQWPHCGVADMEHIFLRDDGRCSRATWGDMPGWRIRNVQPTTQLDPALWDRMVALVRDIARTPQGTSIDLLALIDARAIVADLPKPVDPDLIEARKLAASFSNRDDVSHADYLSGDLDSGDEVQNLLAAIKRGRELATPEVSHVG